LTKLHDTTALHGTDLVLDPGSCTSAVGAAPPHVLLLHQADVRAISLALAGRS
jgi:hypothetical protein